MGSLVSLICVGFMGALFSSKLIGGRSENSSTFHFADKPSLLSAKSGEDASSTEERVSLRTLIETHCPSLFKPFNPLWYLFNGHLQTLYCVFGDFSKTDQMNYQRRYIKIADGGTLGLDFAPVDQDSVPDDAPIIVVQHGLTGGSYEPYVRAILSKACKPVKEGGLGYRAMVINFRGCAGVPVTSPLLYSAGHTDDTRHAVAYLAHKFPKAKLHGLGFSLGSNVLTRYLGEEGSATRLHSTCVLACPWNLKANNDGLLETFIGTHVYQKGMGSNLQRLMKKHFKALTADPSHYVAEAAHKTAALKNPTLAMFDENFTRIVGGPPPHFPFKNAEEYYIWGSSHKIVGDIKVPFLGINAEDDPVVSRVPMDGQGNPMVVMQLTKGGGHLGWFEAGEGGKVDRWTTKPVLEWLKLMGGTVVHPDHPAPRLYVDEDGCIREEGRDRIRAKEMEERRCVVNGNGGEAGILQGL